MNSNTLLEVTILVVGAILGYFIPRFLTKQRINAIDGELRLKQESASLQAEKLILDAKEKARAILEAEKDDLEALKNDEREKTIAIEKLGAKIQAKEESLERQVKEISRKEALLQGEMGNIEIIKKDIDAIKKSLSGELEKIAGFSKEDAKRELFAKVENEYKEELPRIIQRLEKDKRESIEKRTSEIITTAIQRYSRSHVADLTTTVFQLPSEELKGKIIGKEGRNIRTLERLTGIELVVDETPDTMVISSFDPLRREIAKVTLEKLIKDGRIHPAKIEEKVLEATNELNKRMVEIGEEAALEVGIVGLPREIVQLLGRLHFRTSYGQNVLVHSIEMAHISGIIAAELGVNVEIAKKGALLHDIGKAISHEVEGTHVELGRKILKKYGIEEAVIRAMESHHEEYPYSTPESFIVGAADALSAARPGARRDTVEAYIKRLHDLERIVNSFDGVRSSYALSAGREMRVFVVPEKVDDFRALQMARDIAAKIQTEMKYPGEIKVNVIRELRAVEYAR